MKMEQHRKIFALQVILLNYPYHPILYLLHYVCKGLYETKNQTKDKKVMKILATQNDLTYSIMPSLMFYNGREYIGNFMEV